MESLNQLAPYLWRVRGYLIGSSIAALLVAIFWSAGLMLSYPLVKVLLQGQSLQAYLTEETQKAETETAQHQAEAARVQHQLDQLDPNVSSSEKISLLKSLDRAQRQLASSGWRLMFCTWLTKQLSTWLPEQAFPTLVLLLALLALVTLAKGLTVYLQENLVGIAVESTMVMLRQRMFQHVLRLDHVTLSLLGTPQLMARFTYDLQQLGTGLTLFGGRLVVEPLKILSVLICCFLVNWRLTTLSLIVVPLGALLFGRYGKKIKKPAANRWKACRGSSLNSKRRSGHFAQFSPLVSKGKGGKAFIANRKWPSKKNDENPADGCALQPHHRNSRHTGSLHGAASGSLHGAPPEV